MEEKERIHVSHINCSRVVNALRRKPIRRSQSWKTADNTGLCIRTWRTEGYQPEISAKDVFP